MLATYRDILRANPTFKINLLVGVLQRERKHVAGPEDEMLGIFPTLLRSRQGGLIRVLTIESPLPEQFLLVQPRHQFVHDGLQGGVRSEKEKTEKRKNFLDYTEAITGSVARGI